MESKQQKILTKEEKLLAQTKLDGFSNKVKLVHSCVILNEAQNKVSIETNQFGRTTIDVRQSHSRSKMRKQVIVKFTKKDKDWILNVPLTWTCNHCASKFTREEIAIVYLNEVLNKGKK